VATLKLDTRPAGSLIIQSFDDEPLRELARRLPAFPRVLLIETKDGGRWLTEDGLKQAAAFATGIGPSKGLLDGKPEIVHQAHAAGLTVTPYTFTSRAYVTPNPRFKTLTEEMRYFLFDLDVDALFTDNPDQFPR
jgi:glycerophosphoryl diester phosphodiesterase